MNDAANTSIRHFPFKGQRHRAALFSLLCTLLPMLAQAEGLQAIQEILAHSESSPVPAGWTIGGVAYTGSSVYKEGPQSTMPIPGAIYIGQDFMYLGDRAFYTLARQGKLSMTSRARLRMGNLDPKDSPQWDGMHKRQAQLELGLGLNRLSDYGLWTVSMSADVSGRSKGSEWLFSWSAPLVKQNWMVMPSLSLIWRQDKLANYYFGGVSTNEARPGRPAYEVGQAWSLQPSVVASYRVNSQWLVGAILSGEVFPSGIKNSPLVQKSGRYDLLLGVGYVWR